MADSITETTIHQLRPAAFPNLPESKPLFIQCPNCARGVPFSKAAQDQLAAGGVGHECPNCKRYIAVVVGSCCNTWFSVDDKEWDRLAAQQSRDCPACGTNLFLVQRPEVVLGTSFRELPTLCCFLETTAEAAFIEAAKSALGPSDVNRLALYHRTTYERLSLAAEHVEYLQACEFPSSFAMFNNVALADSGPSNLQPSSSALPNLVFQITTSTLSAIESLAHEVNVAIGSPWKEGRVSYKKLRDVPSGLGELRESCVSFIEQSDFVYLKALRNLSMHRRVTTLATMATFPFPAHQSIKPSSVRPECTHYLPDDPDVEPGEETFDAEREVKSTLAALQDRVHIFADDLYGILANVLVDDR